MAIRYLSYNQIDKAKWDALVLKSADGLPYSHSNYLNQICEWGALVKDDYVAVIALPFSKKFGQKYIYTPFMVQQLGIISSDDEDASEWQKMIPNQFKLIEYNSNEIYPFGEEQVNTVLDLNEGYENLRSKFSSNHKRNLKKIAELTINKVSIDEVFDLFIANKGSEIKGFDSAGLERLKCLIKDTPFEWEIEGAYFEENLVCGVVWLKTSGRIIFLFSGNSEKGKSTGAMLYLINEKIKALSKSHLKMDFEGSNNANLARFYKGFGGRHCVYGKYKRYLFPVNLIKK